MNLEGHGDDPLPPVVARLARGGIRAAPRAALCWHARDGSAWQAAPPVRGGERLLPLDWESGLDRGFDSEAAGNSGVCRLTICPYRSTDCTRKIGAGQS